METVQEPAAEHDAAGEATGPVDAADSHAPAGERGHGESSAPQTSATARRRSFLGPTAAVTIIAALIASMTLAAVTAFNTLRSDMALLRDEIGALRTDMHNEIGALRTDMHNEIGALRTEMRDEIAALRSETASIRTELREEIAALRTEMRDEIAAVRSDLGGEIASLRTEMREEIAAVGTDLDDFRAEVGTVLLDHTDRLARLEALILNGALDAGPQPGV